MIGLSGLLSSLSWYTLPATEVVREGFRCRCLLWLSPLSRNWRAR